MLKRGFALSLLIGGMLCAPCFAQSMQYDPSSAVPFEETQINPTDGTDGNGNQNLQFQANQIVGIYQNPYDQSHAATVNGLPPTSMDSFVYEAGGMAELIYGDEGTSDIPPYFGFDPSHRINLGIVGTRAQGLTTGHGSMLPTAWGGDEFDMTEPFSMAGSPSHSAPGTLTIGPVTTVLPYTQVPGIQGGLQSLVGGSNGLIPGNIGF